ncbi:hypothetical protein CROQUDRAFT_315571 [Cronartium quercuum f. sp. fusiforme G11]|uniref:Uncharacterized protein n=1 Tax=Cronartium quercuum f. sp. fusiforme G11 TaxID=708437 RepID=A0A9P6NZF0_9BASI|nr:hypothetical protein CROQUDRAFT_315571 [Cronartium quercuum f. sp. fusiforme G11]
MLLSQSKRYNLIHLLRFLGIIFEGWHLSIYLLSGSLIGAGFCHSSLSHPLIQNIHVNDDFMNNLTCIIDLKSHK